MGPGGSPDLYIRQFSKSIAFAKLKITELQQPNILLLSDLPLIVWRGLVTL